MPVAASTSAARRERFEQDQREPASAADRDSRLSIVATRTIAWSLDRPTRWPVARAGASAAASPRARTTSDIRLSTQCHCGDRNVDGVRVAHRQRRLFHVADDADDGERLPLVRTDAHSLAERIAIAERACRERFADQRDTRRAGDGRAARAGGRGEAGCRIASR